MEFRQVGKTDLGIRIGLKDLAKDLFRLFGQSESKAVKVDLGMDIPKLKAGQLYFLCPTFLH